MLDALAEPAQGVVVGALILCQGPCFGFLGGNFDAGMVVLEPLVATVGIDMGGRRQRRPSPPDFEIVNPAGRRLGDADDAAILGDDDFSFDGLAFLLAGIPETLFSAGSGHCQFDNHLPAMQCVADRLAGKPVI